MMRRFAFCLVLGLSLAAAGFLGADAAQGGRGFAAPTVQAGKAAPGSAERNGAPRGTSAFDGHLVLAFYGRPGAKDLGILGEYPKEELANLLFGYAKLYADALLNKVGAGSEVALDPSTMQAPRGARSAGVVPAFYIVYGVCWPGGDIGYLDDSVVRDWIEYAGRKGIAVFLDHQIGRFGVADAMGRLLPWLSYPNVNLALDPEWGTDDPMHSIGSITAEDLNDAQSMMSDWLVSHGIAGRRMLVVHQFTEKMITDRGKVRADRPGVLLVHTSDGFGSPSLKRSTYAWNARATNMPLKGIKLFLRSEVPGAGFDDPLLTPPEVLDLDPEPALVIYQ